VNAFLSLARIRVLDVLRSKSSATFVLAFPVVLLLVVSVVFSEGHPFERRTIAVVSSEADAMPVRDALGSFSGVRIQIVPREVEARGLMRSKMASALVLPGAPARVIVGERERLFGMGLRSALPAAELDVVAEPRWGYVHYLFPGVLTFSVMLAGLFATGYTLVLYRQNRFLKKLATTPLPKLTFVAAQVAARSVLVSAQVVLLVVAAWLAFDVPLEPAGALWLAAISTLGMLAFMGIGFCLACVIRSEELVVDLISAVTMPLVFLSEIFFPLEALPAPLAAVGAALPSTAMVRLARSVLLYESTDAAGLLPGLALIAVWTVLAFAIGVRSFRWHAS
jgi:ABC-type multidrug transport system permease subunit